MDDARRLALEILADAEHERAVERAREAACFPPMDADDIRADERERVLREVREAFDALPTYDLHATWVGASMEKQKDELGDWINKDSAMDLFAPGSRFAPKETT